MALTRPIVESERNLTGLDFFLLWIGAAISLGEIWAGGLLVPLGLVGGLLAILVGHLIGNTPMALGGIIGSRHGVPAMVSTRGALGVRGSHLPALLNIVQLVGWTAVMLWVCGSAAANLSAAGQGHWNRKEWIVIAGAVTTVWALVGHRVWKWAQRIAVALLILLSLLMTFVVFREHGLASLLQAPRKPDSSFMLAVDLVIAMPISWLPLISDYSRYARTTRGSFWGAWCGYLAAGSWMYAVGLSAALATGSETPDGMVMQIMSGLGFIGPALAIVILSTMTTTFLDIYSNAISTLSIFPRWNEKIAVVMAGLLGTLLAVFFPANQYETFLLFIGAMFCPLFGVVLTDYFVLKGGRYDAEALFGGERYAYSRGVNPRAIAAWAVGFGIFELCQHQGWVTGASLPAMVGAGLVYFVLMNMRRKT